MESKNNIKNPELTDTENRLAVARRGVGRGGVNVSKMGKGGQRYKLLVVTKLSQGYVLYSTVTTASNTVVNIWKLLEEYILKVLITRKKQSMPGDGCY